LFKKIIDRVEKQGFFSTLNYFIFTVALEKLGFEIIKQFVSIKPTKSIQQTHNIDIYSDIVDIPRSLINDLINECGQRFTSTVKLKLENGDKIAIGCVNERAASIAWLKQLEYELEGLSMYQAWLIHGCLTLPKYRGLGLYPKSITKLQEFVFESEYLKNAVLIESSIANNASLRGIIQCGFNKFGYIVNFKNKILFCSKKSIVK